ncbi:hypothetical protein DF139_33385 [Burkholderia stagnalis]|uniref:contractile injection system tape measure protein n=1 Tax=Burkholderia stagnalis TaxID=1503054 RepID=UPI000F560CE1|nr:contractile injection system tape measure protein [Burkholderia stagnalis]RQQ47902.1 hypothetical protein DF158_33375 [Burkholderia stagnalis]RQQ59571.1 hypothetical protein DF137_33430 [Burkholderia stagnalis]RQQ60025.1 hypothetical protein DF139_33385 [Burkholderia stagnalis]RQQ74681.1 hypothetical protein DF138_32815 [Burkholderia stagnalis]RQQ80280.1 hypothetical protein DF136_33330 [Burkholderia stagnalis]
MTNRHRIDRLAFRLHTSLRDADGLQRRCSASFHDTLRADMAEVVAQCDDAETDDVRTLDRLVIDLGDIHLATFERDLQLRVPAELARTLQAALGARMHAPSSEPPRRAAASASPSRPRTPSAAAVPGDDASAGTGERHPDAWTTWLAYLDTGSWVVPAREAGARRDAWMDSPDRCLAHLMHTRDTPSPAESSAARLALAERGLQPRARRRLLATRDASALRALFDWLIAPTQLALPAQPDWPRLMPLGALLVLQQQPLAVQERLSRALSAGGAMSAASAGHAITTTPMPPTLTTPHSPETGREARSVPDTTSAPPAHDARGTRPTRATPPVDRALTVCIEALLATSLTTPMRHLLRDGLMAGARATEPPAVLAALPAALRARLVAALGLHAPRATLHPPEARARAAESAGTIRARRTLTRSVAEPVTEPAAKPAAEAVAKPAARPSKRAAERDADTPLAVSNAGLTLLWPVLPRLFQTFGLVDAENRWAPDGPSRAVALLDWLAWGDTPPADWRLPVPRLLGGLPLWPDDSDPLDCPPLDVPQQAYADSWLSTTLTVLPGLQRLGVADVRTFFLQRPGTLADDDGRLTLTVEADATDVLLSQLPWPLTQVMLPWLTSPITLKWIA